MKEATVAVFLWLIILIYPSVLLVIPILGLMFVLAVILEACAPNFTANLLAFFDVFAECAAKLIDRLIDGFARLSPSREKE